MDVVLLSGGIESTTLLYELRADREVAALFIDYGQRAATQEALAAATACRHTHTALTALNVRRLGAELAAPGFLTAHVPLPARNLLAVSLAANWALNRQGKTVFLGLQRDDQTHTEGRPVFIRALTETLAALGLVLAVPYQELTKSEVVARGKTWGVDYAQTYSCLTGRRGACGRCPQCLARQQALKGDAAIP